MIVKSHNIKKFVLLGIFSIFNGNLAFGAEWQCFPSIDAYMSMSYGENYRDDENISIREEKYGKGKLFFVTDKTSGTNYARYLLRKMKPGQFCLVLSTPPVAQLVAGTRDETGFPKKFFATDQAPPGLPAHEITYVLDQQSFRYDAKICNEVLYANKKRNVKSVSCDEFLAQ